MGLLELIINKPEMMILLIVVAVFTEYYRLNPDNYSYPNIILLLKI